LPGHQEAPPAGFEPALTAPEAVALSPELWGLCDTKGYQPQTLRGHVALWVSGWALIKSARSPGEGRPFRTSATSLMHPERAPRRTPPVPLRHL
jgi:hypothetical protein